MSGSINAEAAKINCGDSADVSWKTSETVDAAVVADTGTLKESELNGSVKVQPKQTTTYNLHASGPGGTVTSAATVDVNRSSRVLSMLRRQKFDIAGLATRCWNREPQV